MCGQYVLYLMLVNGFTLVAITVTQDPCQTGNHQELGDALKRSPDYAMDATPICDRYLLEGWYTAPSRVMPRSAPGLGFCNTLYPYWMKGTPPAEVGQEIDVEICGVGFSSCDKSFTVKVKRCPSFLVYRLLPLDSCNSAYCFENTGNCVSETPTGIEVVYHGVSYTSKTDGGVIQHEPVINLLCRFTPLLDSTLFYHVDWYVNKTRVLENQTVDSTALDKAVFSTQDLYVAGEKLGCSIHCIVGAKKTIAESPCNSSSSALFYAGIEVLTPVLNMSRKGQTTLRIRPTIPYASQTLEFQNQNEKLEISQPLYINLEFPSTIQSACVVDGTSPNLCEMKLPSFKYSERHKYGNTSLWYKEYAMTVYNRDDLGYAIQNSMILRLKTGGQGANAATVFEQTALPDIPINIHDDSTEWKGRYCYSRGDPHMRTFDGYKYECHHVGCETGITMVLYENKVHDQEVQVRHHKCIYPNARCIYTLAVRSGNDVFIIDIRNNTKYINFPICEDKSLKVVKASDRRYKVFLPTGTYVEVWIYLNYADWFMNVNVFPSMADVGNSSGLCGVLGGGHQNDLTRRNGIEDDPTNFDSANHPDEFSVSWRVPADQDLLSESMDFQTIDSLSRIKSKLCTCNKKHETECTYDSYKTINCSTITRGKKFPCLLHNSNSRRKRHAAHVSSFYTELDENHVISKRQTGYSDEEASVICNADFQASLSYQICIQNVAVFSNESIQDCILDLMLTGDPNVTSLHIESALNVCQTLVGLNLTLQENSTITYEILSICPNNCSGQGECSAGSCVCRTGYGGSDCSFDISRPPTVTSLLGNGLCDLTKDTCNDITMFGQYFVENMNTYCFITRNEISAENAITGVDFYNTSLEERTLFEGFCRLVYETNNTWVTQFVFNMSNDEAFYSDTFSVYVYQSECQIVNNYTGNIFFTLQEGFCFIDGQCIRDNVFESNSPCLKCDTMVNKYNWSDGCFNQTTSTINTTMTPESTTISTAVTDTTIATAESSITSMGGSSPTLPTAKSNSSKKSDSHQQLTYIIGGAVAAAVVTLVITGILIKKYCFSKTEVKAFRSDNQIGQWNHVDNNASSKDNGQFRPHSMQSYHSPHIERLPPTHDFSRMYDSTKDRSHLFRAQI